MKSECNNMHGERIKKAVHIFTKQAVHIFTKQAVHIFTKQAVHIFTKQAVHIFTKQAVHIFTKQAVHIFTNGPKRPSDSELHVEFRAAIYYFILRVGKFYFTLTHLALYVYV